jgi:thiol-disulfide isomerase/thioredoxin
MRFVCLALLLCLVAAAAGAGAASPEEVAVGQALRSAHLQGLNGPSIDLDAFRGRPLLVNVWASWCGPCRAEMASLERLAWLDPDRSYSMIGISTDDFRDRAASWLKATNSTLSHFLDQKLQMENMLGASRLPLTVLVDAQGRVIMKVYGSREWDSPDSLALIDKAFGIGRQAPARLQRPADTRKPP